ncbi:MAG: hypothetical protein H6738_20960 [Alphaproteobacteria bacterium]|nr:hypothetical protein [Alphaproteobacteria bacterium]MCB9699264.1 hypothetical protein [Alphaproteobacteria bacterium]
MSSSRSMLPLLVVAAGAAVIVPVMLGTVWNTWRTQVEARNPTEDAVQEALRVQAERDAAHQAAKAHEASNPEPVGDPVYDKDSDRLLLNMFGEYAMTEDRVDDAMPEEAFRVDAVRGEQNLAGQLFVDLNRDGRIDEEWTIRPPEVFRHSEPQGDGFAKHERWENRWVPVEDQ